MAWRNIWRSKRRTLVIISAVFIGVASMVFLSAISRGMVYSMVENSINNFTGHILIRDADFVSDPVVENRIKDAESIAERVKNELPEAKVVKRIRLNAVLNTARNTEGVSLVGIYINKEEDASFIGSAPLEGSGLKNDNAILIGRALSEKIGLGQGKKVIISMQSAEGETVSRAYRIAGIYDAGQEQLEKRYVFVTYNSAEKMLSVHGDATEISIILPENDVESDIYSAYSEELKAVLDKKYSVMSWREVMPALSSYLDLFDSFMLIWYLVVFIAMGFGIVNTILMAVYERIREFGLIRALGVKWTGIFRMVVAETSLIILLGLAAGNIAGLLLVWYFSSGGLDLTQFAKGVEMFGVSRVVYPVLTFGDILMTDATVLILGLIISLYPAYKACSFTPVQTMRDM